MFNLKYLLLLSLISFSIQDSHCLITYSYCLFESKIAHCSYEENNECVSCEDWYAISFDKKSCKPFQNCNQLAEGDNKCYQCESYYSLNTDGNCESERCSSGYYLKDKTCQKISIPYCITVSSNKETECTTCFPGYYLKDNTCQKISIPYCMTVKSTKETECTTCFPGYYLKDNTCQKISIPYCEFVSDKNENECTSCLEGSPVNGKCATPIEGCSTYGQDGKCTDCDSEYEKKEDGSCVFIECKNGKKITTCDVCEVGFYKDEDNTCTGYDGTKDSSAGKKIKNYLLILALALII